jgi:hypothetical protein
VRERDLSERGEENYGNGTLAQGTLQGEKPQRKMINIEP